MDRKENYLRALLRKDPEWVPMEYEEDLVKVFWMPLAERPARAGKDVFGVEWAYSPEAEGGTYPAERDFVITDIEKWKDQIRIPDLDAACWESARLWISQVDREKYLVQGNSEMGIFERAYLLLGMENALMAYYTNPDEMYELCGAIADYKIKFLERFIEIVKPDIIWYGDDWGMQNNLFISPEVWRAIIKPHTKRIYDCIKSHNVILKQHSCGKIESVFGDMCEMGADAYNPCQPCNDLAGLKEKYGDKICFCGGIDSQFVLSNANATAEDVRNEVKKRIRELALPHGGYLAGPSHDVPYDPEKLEAMMNTIYEYGRDIYQQKR